MFDKLFDVCIRIELEPVEPNIHHELIVLSLRHGGFNRFRKLVVASYMRHGVSDEARSVVVA